MSYKLGDTINFPNDYAIERLRGKEGIVSGMGIHWNSVVLIINIPNEEPYEIYEELLTSYFENKFMESTSEEGGKS